MQPFGGQASRRMPSAGAHLRIGVPLGVAVAAAGAVGLQILPPARGHVGLEVVDALRPRMDVDIDQAELGLLPRARAGRSRSLHGLLQAPVGRERVVHHDLAAQRVRASPAASPRRRRTASADSRRSTAASRRTAGGRRSGATTSGDVRRIERLDGQAEVLAEDLRRRAVDPRHLGAAAAPELGQPPQERRHPGHARTRSARPSAWGTSRTRPRRSGSPPATGSPATGWRSPRCSKLFQPSEVGGCW